MTSEAGGSTIIATERLLLRRITPEDAAVSHDGGTPEGLRFAEGFPSDFSREVIDLFVGHRAAEAVAFTPWYIIRRAEGDVIGTTGYSLPLGPHRPTVGYEIVEPLWGQGYASEALYALLAYLFTLPGVESVEADTLESHVASRRVMEKAGMTHFDTRRAEVDGVSATLVFYEVWRPEPD